MFLCIRCACSPRRLMSIVNRYAGDTFSALLPEMQSCVCPRRHLHTHLSCLIQALWSEAATRATVRHQATDAIINQRAQCVYGLYGPVARPTVCILSPGHPWAPMSEFGSNPGDCKQVERSHQVDVKPPPIHGVERQSSTWVAYYRSH